MKMEGWCPKLHALAKASVLLLMVFFPVTYGWGIDGHLAVCRIAQSRLSEAAADAVRLLLPDYAENDLGSLCSWADDIKKISYSWSSALHFVNTPDVCEFQYDRDCKDRGGKGRCVVGAINNYTGQLLSYNNGSSLAQFNVEEMSDNLTEALLFLAHFMGDIHQPLHCGFASDRGGNVIGVHWYANTDKVSLHDVWDDNIIETAEGRYYNANVESFIDAIQQNITTEWKSLVQLWETCSGNKITCPEIYASESTKAACEWAYKDAANGSVLEDEYFLSRLPILSFRLAQGGVRLAATLNRIFNDSASGSSLLQIESNMFEQ